MHADLVGAAGVDLRLDQRRGVQPFEHTVTRVRGTTGIVVARRHALAVRWMPGNGGADFAGFTREFTAHNRVVNFFDLPFGKLRGEREMRFVVFGDDEAAAGFLVEPMHDAGPGNAADAAERAPAMVEQGVDERVFLVSGGGMNDQSGGLVQNQQRFVLEKNGEWNFLRPRFGRPGVRPANFDLLARSRAVRGFGRMAIDTDVALFNQSFQRDA